MKGRKYQATDLAGRMAAMPSQSVSVICVSFGLNKNAHTNVILSDVHGFYWRPIFNFHLLMSESRIFHRPNAHTYMQRT